MGSGSLHLLSFHISFTSAFLSTSVSAMQMLGNRYLKLKRHLKESLKLNKCLHTQLCQTPKPHHFEHVIGNPSSPKGGFSAQQIPNLVERLNLFLSKKNSFYIIPCFGVFCQFQTQKSFQVWEPSPHL